MVNSREYIPCNSCNANNYKIIHKGGSYNVVTCSECGLYYLNPRPNSKSIKSFYQKEYYHGGLNSTGYSNYSILQTDLELEAKKRLTVIKQYVNKGKLIDIGCGYGHFLNEAKQAGFQVMGLDISEEAIKQLKLRYGIPGQTGEVKKGFLAKSRFEVITAWDVVEHLPNPKISFKAIASIQKTNGYLFLTTPSVDSIDAKLLGKYWYGFKRIPEHLYFFSEKQMSLYLEQLGYKIIRILPWGFYRNIGYCVDQLSRYSLITHKVISKLIKMFGVEGKSYFFPIIDMFVIAQKK